MPIGWRATAFCSTTTPRAVSRWRRGVSNTNWMSMPARPPSWRRGPIPTAVSPVRRAASSALRMEARSSGGARQVPRNMAGVWCPNTTRPGRWSGRFTSANHWNYRARKVPEDQLPLRIGCRNPLACNFDPAAIVDGDRLFIGQPCDDGNPCTVQDAINNQCECLGEALVGNPEEGQCLDPMAVNYDSCSVPDIRRRKLSV